MTINVAEKEAKTFIIAPEGNLDYITSPQFEEAVTQTAAKADKLIIDIGKINYIASAGLRVLLNADDLMSEKGGMVLTNVNDYIRDILSMTGFLSILKID